jgi:hypothetical protein
MIFDFLNLTPAIREDADESPSCQGSGSSSYEKTNERCISQRTQVASLPRDSQLDGCEEAADLPKKNMLVGQILHETLGRCRGTLKVYVLEASEMVGTGQGVDNVRPTGLIGIAL